MRVRRKTWLGAIALGGSVLGCGILWAKTQLSPYLKPLTEEISVTNLARFANGEPLSDTLSAYNRLPQVENLRPYLRQPLYGDPKAIPQLVDSPEGEILLERLGRLVQTHDRHNSAGVLREALIAAAAEEDLSLIRVLRQFPEAKIRINGSELLRTSWAVGRSLHHKRRAIARLEQQFQRERSLRPPSFPGQPALIQPGGAVAWSTWVIDDSERGRALWIDLYRPAQEPEQPLPVVMISHGLTASRRTFSYLAHHLASHGFLVVAVEHPDSNGDAHQAFLAGEADALLPPETLIERPRDISFVLNALEEAGLEQWFDLNNVGLIGHSLGGNTALALAGARIDREQLSQICTEQQDSLNPSLIFAQCPLLRLPDAQTQTSFRDRRITAAMAINPVASQVFSHESLQAIKIPLFMVASEQDWVTPPVEEQLMPFEQLGTLAHPATYLALLRGGEHWTAMGGYECLVPGPRLKQQTEQQQTEQHQTEQHQTEQQAAQAQPPSASAEESRQREFLRRRTEKAIARDYLCSLSAAFFKTSLSQEPLTAYLSADYAASLSQPELPLILVQEPPQRSPLKSSPLVGLLKTLQQHPRAYFRRDQRHSRLPTAMHHSH